MLISDPDADKSAASLDVRIGSASEPKEIGGLAHFLEHMLFQGTEKYPGINEYFEYLKDNAGSSNAYTSLTNTNYHFEVSNAGLEKALDIFAQFFISPLIEASATKKEMNAVDSEFNMSKQNDNLRGYVMMMKNSHLESNLNRFWYGNLESLDRPNIREELLAFHTKWYSANIMKLVISSKSSLDELQKWAVEKFTPIVNKKVELPNLGQPILPYTSENLGQLIKFPPVADKDSLSIAWFLPNCHE
jgi:insulysin